MLGGEAVSLQQGNNTSPDESQHIEDCARGRKERVLVPEVSIKSLHICTTYNLALDDFYVRQYIPYHLSQF